MSGITPKRTSPRRSSPRRPIPSTAAARVAKSGKLSKDKAKTKKQEQVYSIGTKVYKESETECFFGTITMYDDGQYPVVYTDGVSETRDNKEIRELVLQAEEKIAQGNQDNVEDFEADTKTKGNRSAENHDDQSELGAKTKGTGKRKSTNVASKRSSLSSSAFTPKKSKTAKETHSGETSNDSSMPLSTNDHIRSRLVRPETQKTLDFFFDAKKVAKTVVEQDVRPTKQKTLKAFFGTVKAVKRKADEVGVTLKDTVNTDSDEGLNIKGSESSVAKASLARKCKKVKSISPPTVLLSPDSAFSEDESNDESESDDDKKPATKVSHKKLNAKPTTTKPTATKNPVVKVVKKKNANGGTIGYDKQPYSGGSDLPLISDIQEMFDDMIKRNMLKDDNNEKMLIGLLHKLKNRPLRVATMCSGTESPVLALDMLQKAIRDACREHTDRFGMFVSDDNGYDRIFQLEHIFSCEIEPFKQAYIERNFHPPLLFRDIRELGQDQAYTAYGALVDVPNTPGCVDILIAGTSCVDYSNLNNQKVRRGTFRTFGQLGSQ